MERLYVSALLDLFNREIIAIKSSYSPNLKLIEATIRAAQKKRKLANLNGVIIHSDQGSVYRSNEYHHLCKTLQFTPSMSRKANCWDNAVIESFFSQLKCEFPCFYPDTTGKNFESNLEKYIRYYNEKRTHSKLGYVSPKRFLRDNYIVA
ncbi:DDE-type integrase/transposase/recombinase [Bacillus suaedaesalsae]|uniref:DDE-type integrase/transposase/recombinase n=1 Tax=Bacillus suaedaesalsae TaxID=2810349 RepID=A0ABS2DGS1_9BACI|nr:DDE-type integrase/transposase/recombinase [Bacillus suaedaesalsae]